MSLLTPRKVWVFGWVRRKNRRKEQIKTFASAARPPPQIWLVPPPERIRLFDRPFLVAKETAQVALASDPNKPNRLGFFCKGKVAGKAAKKATEQISQPSKKANRAKSQPSKKANRAKKPTEQKANRATKRTEQKANRAKKRTEQKANRATKLFRRQRLLRTLEHHKEIFFGEREYIVVRASVNSGNGPTSAFWFERSSRFFCSVCFSLGRLFCSVCFSLGLLFARFAFRSVDSFAQFLAVKAQTISVI